MLLLLNLPFFVLAQNITAKTGSHLTVYVTAKNTNLRFSPTETLTLKPVGQPGETQPSVFVGPSKTFQTMIGIGGKISVVVMNATDDKIPYTLWIKGNGATVTSLPHSIATLVIDGLFLILLLMNHIFKKQPIFSVSVLLLILIFSLPSFAMEGDYYQLKIYHLKTKTQEERLDNYLQNAYLPKLHKMGIKTVGVFKPVEQDTAADKKVYVLVPFSSLKKLATVEQELNSDQQYLANGKDYIDAGYKDAAFTRMETVILSAFPKMLHPAAPNLSAPKTQRVYELRSYESPTEKYNRNKVKMFNDGNEVALFKRLNFNAVFYAEVLAGSHMPNLMYMTAFNSKQDRDKHWETFSADAEWKALSARPEYQNNVSRNEMFFLHPTAYSDF